MVIREARRQNAAIQRRKQIREPLRHLLNENGTKSELFPESVSELLNLDGNLALSTSYSSMADSVAS
jgi:hypothetical protein